MDTIIWTYVFWILFSLLVILMLKANRTLYLLRKKRHSERVFEGKEISIGVSNLVEQDILTVFSSAPIDLLAIDKRTSFFLVVNDHIVSSIQQKCGCYQIDLQRKMIRSIRNPNRTPILLTCEEEMRVEIPARKRK